MNRLAPEKILWVRKGEGIAAQGKVPAEAPFFQDHFPAFPVLPGVLSLDILKTAAQIYFKETGEAAHGAVRKIEAAKFASYLKPGDEWEAQLKLVASEPGSSKWEGRLLSQNRTAASVKLYLDNK